MDSTLQDCIHLRDHDAYNEARRRHDMPLKSTTVFYCGVHFKRMCESCFNDHMSEDWRNGLHPKPPNFSEDAMPVDLLYERKFMPNPFERGRLREALIPRVFNMAGSDVQ